MRWLLSWALYWAGHLAYLWNDSDSRFTEAGHRLYQWLMARAAIIQGDGAGPWEKIDRP